MDRSAQLRSLDTLALSRFGLYSAATLGLIQILLGLATALFRWTPEMADFLAVPICLGLAAALLLPRQPQFAAVFALLGSPPANTLMVQAGMAVVDLWYLVGPVFWLILLRHPTEIDVRYRKPVALLFAAHSALAATMLGPLNRSMAAAGIWLAMLLVALVLLSLRCLTGDSVRSPRTLLVVLGIAPVVVIVLLRALSLIPSSPTTEGLAVVALCISPLGALLNEMAFHLSKGKALAR